jgi:glycosyltransferase involved in cell wall biosynthesis
LAQTFNEFEFIIVNDGSKDKTAEILDRYARQDNRIKVYSHPKNRGIVDSLNLGLEKAETNYIARMDADDICRLSRLDEQYSYFENHRDYILVGAQANLIDAEGNHKGETNVPVFDTEIRKELFYGRNVILHSTVMFKNDFKFLYRNYAYPTEDYDLWLRLLKKGKVHILNERLMDYRLNPEGISFLNAARQMEIIRKVRNKVLLGMEIDEVPPKNLEKIRKLYSKFINKSSTVKKYSVKWLLLKMFMILLNPFELSRMKYFRWIGKYWHFCDYENFVYGSRKESEGETVHDESHGPHSEVFK